METNNFVKADPFMPNTEFSHPMDMIFGTDGHLYVLEYGQKWNSQNLDARLSRIRYVAGNRAPVAVIDKDKQVGSHPLTVQFSGESSFDHDHDKLSYTWSFTSDEVLSTETNPSFTFNEAGDYTVRLTVTDADGQISESTTKLQVGNDPPEINVEIDPSGLHFWDNKEVSYKITVQDQQDGKTADQSLNASDVKVTFDYIPLGEDIIQATVGHQQNEIPEGKTLIETSDCKACHGANIKVNGPSYADIALKYTKKDISYLVDKIIKGGSGVWGEAMMSAHPQLNAIEVEKIVSYILTLNPDKRVAVKSLPLQGKFKFDQHLGSDEIGKYMLIASYLDKGNSGQENSALAAREELVFNPFKLEAENADEISKDHRIMGPDHYRFVGSLVHNSFLRFDNINLKNLSSITFAAMYKFDEHFKGRLEIREDSIDGPIIGKARFQYYDKNNRGKKYYKIPLSPTKEKATLYFVFKNPEDTSQFIVRANWIMLNYKQSE